MSTRARSVATCPRVVCLTSSQAAMRCGRCRYALFPESSGFRFRSMELAISQRRQLLPPFSRSIAHPHRHLLVHRPRHELQNCRGRAGSGVGHITFPFRKTTLITDRSGCTTSPHGQATVSSPIAAPAAVRTQPARQGAHVEVREMWLCQLFSTD